MELCKKVAQWNERQRYLEKRFYELYYIDRVAAQRAADEYWFRAARRINEAAIRL